MRPSSPTLPPGAPTAVAIALVAYALCDLCHEVAGHGLATLLVPGVRAVSLSTVALQTTGTSRLVAAAGSIANLVAGGAALVFFHRRERFSPGAYFLWLFGSLNLLNGCGYPLYSAVLGSGDWEVVVRGFDPVWAWRVGLGLAGAAAYAGAVLLAAVELARPVKRDVLAREAIPRLVFPAYLAGGALLTLASAFNPIGPALIILSGVSSGFGAMAGLTAVPALVGRWVRGGGRGEGMVSFSPAWIAAGIVVGTLFVAVVGPGIRL
jgi:hypothetical protein